MADREFHLGDGDGQDPLALRFAQVGDRVAALSEPPSLPRLQELGRVRRRRRATASTAAGSLVAVLAIWAASAALTPGPPAGAGMPGSSASGPGRASSPAGPGPSTPTSGQPSGQSSAQQPGQRSQQASPSSSALAGSVVPTGSSTTPRSPSGPASPAPPGQSSAASSTGPGTPAGSVGPQPTATSPSGSPTGSLFPSPTPVPVTVLVMTTAPAFGCRSSMAQTRQLASDDAASAIRATLAGVTAQEAGWGLTSPFGPAAAAAADVHWDGLVLVVDFTTTAGINGSPLCRGSEAQALLYRTADRYGVTLSVRVKGNAVAWSLWAAGL